jgi:hypothetical protein
LDGIGGDITEGEFLMYLVEHCPELERLRGLLPGPWIMDGHVMEKLNLWEQTLTELEVQMFYHESDKLIVRLSTLRFQKLTKLEVEDFSFSPEELGQMLQGKSCLTGIGSIADFIKCSHLDIVLQTCSSTLGEISNVDAGDMFMDIILLVLFIFFQKSEEI